MFSKGHNSRKGDNSDKKKNTTGQLFFHEESIYEISKPRYGIHQISFRFFQMGITPERGKGDNSDKKKKRVSNIFP